MATKKPRFTITVEPELYEAIDDFRFKYRFESKSDATAELVRRGLIVVAEEERRAANHDKA